MNLPKANEDAMAQIERAAMSEQTKNMTYGAVAWYLFDLYKRGGEVVFKDKPTIPLGENGIRPSIKTA